VEGICAKMPGELLGEIRLLPNAGLALDRLPPGVDRQKPQTLEGGSQSLAVEWRDVSPSS